MRPASVGLLVTFPPATRRLLERVRYLEGNGGVADRQPPPHHLPVVRLAVRDLHHLDLERDAGWCLEPEDFIGRVVPGRGRDAGIRR